MSDETIHRALHDEEHPYLKCSRATTQDKTISYEALGLLAYLLSKSDNWDVVISDLMRKGCGRDKAYKLLNELKDAGYIVHGRLEAGHEKPPLWSERHIHERPFTELQETVQPYPETPYPVKPVNGKTAQPITDSTNKRFKQNITQVPDHAPAHEAMSSGKNPYALYAENIGNLTPIMADTLKDAVKDYSAEWVYDAIWEAVEQNVRRWSYIAPILERWKVEGKNTPRPAKVNGKPRASPPLVKPQAPSTSVGAPNLREVNRARTN